MHGGGRRAYIGIFAIIHIAAWVILAMVVAASGRADLFSVLFVVLSGLWLLKCVRASIEVDATGITVRRIIGVRRISWGQVDRINARTGLAWRQVSLLLQSGKTVKLPAPGDWWPMKDPHFDHNVEVLKSFCGTYRNSTG
jgi:hypothetical protein